MIVKANRAGLYARCADLITDADPDDLRRDVTTSRGHGRTEERILIARALTDDDRVDFPDAAQVLRIVRYTGDLDGQRTTKEIVHAKPAFQLRHLGLKLRDPRGQPLDRVCLQNNQPRSSYDGRCGSASDTRAVA